MSKHNIEYLNPNDLIAYENNSRKHDADQIERIKKSIQEFGFINPVLIEEDNTIIAGHARVQSAIALSLKEVPTIKITHLTENQIKAYVIADNRLAELSTWDDDILISEIDILGSNGFDIDVLGFSVDDISKMFDQTKDIEIDDLTGELDEFEISIKGNSCVRIEVLNAINDAIKEYADVEIFCHE